MQFSELCSVVQLEYSTHRWKAKTGCLYSIKKVILWHESWFLWILVNYTAYTFGEYSIECNMVFLSNISSISVLLLLPLFVILGHLL